MTLQREDPGVWRATCDTCGDNILLDTSAHEPLEDALAEIEGAGWTARPPERVKFKALHDRRGFTTTYLEHDCPDCV